MKTAISLLLLPIAACTYDSALAPLDLGSDSTLEITQSTAGANNYETLVVHAALKRRNGAPAPGMTVHITSSTETDWVAAGDIAVSPTTEVVSGDDGSIDAQVVGSVAGERTLSVVVLAQGREQVHIETSGTFVASRQLPSFDISKDATTVCAQVPFDLHVKAMAQQQVATTYRGVVNLLSPDDPSATLPPQVQFNPADRGEVVVHGVVARQVGTLQFRARDSQLNGAEGSGYIRVMSTSRCNYPN